MTGARTMDQPLLAIFAHPDDELFISPVLANYAKRGIDCYLAIATDGRFGIQPHTGGVAGDALAEMRTGELRRAAEVLGIHPPVQLGFEDGFGHKTSDLKKALGQYSDLYRKILQLFAEIQPGAVITFGGDGIYGHPDHVMVGNAVTSAFQGASFENDPTLHYTAVCKELVPEGLDALVLAESGTIPVFPVARRHLRVQIEVDREDLELARKSIACHESQFVAAQLDRISGLFHSDTTVYFRSWDGQGATNSLYKQR
jgi:LmbE family N-acetylglucosaminyl deacetylase